MTANSTTQTESKKGKQPRPFRSLREILTDYCSYIGDLESGLQMDHSTWKAYQRNAAPFLTDLVIDFSKSPSEMSTDQIKTEVRKAVAQYLGR